MLTETRRRPWDGAVEREKHDRLRRWRVFSVVAATCDRSPRFSDAGQGSLLDHAHCSEPRPATGVSRLADSTGGAEASLTPVYSNRIIQVFCQSSGRSREPAIEPALKPGRRCRTKRSRRCEGTQLVEGAVRAGEMCSF